jgi:hypothetical protein
MSKAWIIWDGRYHTDPDRAIACEVCSSRKEAEQNAPDYGDDCYIEEVDWPEEPVPRRSPGERP